MEIKFEKFINNFSSEKKRINRFLNISAKYSNFNYKKGSSFDHKVSKKNVKQLSKTCFWGFHRFIEIVFFLVFGFHQLVFF